MTDTTEQEALALVNEVLRERGATRESVMLDRAIVGHEALFRAIERHETDIADLQAEYEEVCKLHEAFRQEVSDAVEQYWASLSGAFVAKPPPYMARFIIAKPVDPLAQAWREAWPGTPEENAIAETGLLLAAIEKRGGKIVWGEG